MPLRLYIGLIVLLLTALSGALGYGPFALFPGGWGPYTLSLITVCILFFFLGRRSQFFEQQLLRATTRLQSVEVQSQVLTDRLEALALESRQMLDQLDSLHRTMSQQEILAPARLLLAQERYAEAVKLLQEGTPSESDNVEISWLLGEALMGSKRYAEALPHLLTGLRTADVHRLALVAQCEQTLGLYAEAESHLEQLIAARGTEPGVEDLLELAAVQKQVAPARAKRTLMQVLKLNPYNSVARYQLIDLDIEVGDYESAIGLATEGLERNTSDVGCFVSRAEAYFRRGRPDDEKRILDDLATAQVRNRKDYNIYRLRGALHQRRARRSCQQPESQQKLREALSAYEDGLANVPPKFHAHLYAAASRVLLQLARFEEAVNYAQQAVKHYPGHVSNHLALAFAQLATRQWKAAVETAERGIQWAGWGGRVWLTAIGIFANACAGSELDRLRSKCAALTSDLQAGDRHFALSESWDAVRVVLYSAIEERPGHRAALVTDTIALLEQGMTLDQYSSRWVNAEATRAKTQPLASQAAIS